MRAREFFEGIRNFDPELDYTAVVRYPDGVRNYRNPKEDKATGERTDKEHNFREGGIVTLYGTSFWNWKEGTVQRVGIDIDTSDGHADGHGEEAFEEISSALASVPWLELVRSKGGKGLHAFANLTTPVEIKTRKEQSALGNAVSVAASRIAGIDVKDAKDCAGGNLWQYAETTGPGAWEVIKEATETLDPASLPPGWRDAATGTGKVEFAPDEVPLEQAHLEIEKQIEATGYPIIYRKEHNCWHVHTYALKLAAEEHGYKGFFDTVSDGRDKSEPNAFMFALPGGGFRVHRFNEHSEPNWVNGNYCFLNEVTPVIPTFKHFSIGANEEGYVFQADGITKCLKAIGCDVPEILEDREVGGRIGRHRIMLTTDKRDNDSRPEGWVASPNGKQWQHVVAKPGMSEAAHHTQIAIANTALRALALPGESTKWAHRKPDGEWVATNLSEAKGIAGALGIERLALGSMRLNPYTIVCEPFKDEYLSGRRWNMANAKYACEPATEPGDTPTWDLIWNHLGKSLDDGIEYPGICDGAHYLQQWFALLLRNPLQRLPYLFFFSEDQGSGKSTLGKAASRYLISPGAGEITAETITDKFTSELEGKVLCLIEEVDLCRRGAYERIKNLITAPEVSIRKMRTDTYTVPNISHFIHTANSPYFVPSEREDTRITIGKVAPLAEPIEEADLHERLKEEAPYMLRKLLTMEITRPIDSRLWLPALNTSVKEEIVCGVYGSDLSESQQAVIDFNEKCLKAGGEEVRAKVWDAYLRFMGKPAYEGVPPVHRNQLLSVLNDQCHLGITSTRKRTGNGEREYFYDGITLLN